MYISREYLVDNRDGKRQKPDTKFSHTIKGDLPSITMHETSNYNKGASAEMHGRWLTGDARPPYSWHATVDDGDIFYQHVEWYECAWAAGDGWPQGHGNRSSIHIEVCTNPDSDINKAWDNGVKLARWLIQNNHAKDVIYQHNHWTGKNCPRLLRSGRAGSQTWEKVTSAIKENLPTVVSDTPSSLTIQQATIYSRYHRAYSHRGKAS